MKPHSEVLGGFGGGHSSAQNTLYCSWAWCFADIISFHPPATWEEGTVGRDRQPSGRAAVFCLCFDSICQRQTLVWSPVLDSSLRRTVLPRKQTEQRRADFKRPVFPDPTSKLTLVGRAQLGTPRGRRSPGGPGLPAWLAGSGVTLLSAESCAFSDIPVTAWHGPHPCWGHGECSLFDVSKIQPGRFWGGLV